MDYLTLKWIHVLSSTILFGTGLGSAFYMFVANRHKEIGGIAFATRFVVIADWLFTTPAALIQPLTGVAMAESIGVPLMSGWVGWSLLLYVVSGLCWLPVVWIQIRMRDLAAAAHRDGAPLPPLYWHFERWWIGLGAIAFPIFVVIFYLMVAKP